VMTAHMFARCLQATGHLSGAAQAHHPSTRGWPQGRQACHEWQRDNTVLMRYVTSKSSAPTHAIQSHQRLHTATIRHCTYMSRGMLPLWDHIAAAGLYQRSRRTQRAGTACRCAALLHEYVCAAMLWCKTIQGIATSSSTQARTAPVLGAAALMPCLLRTAWPGCCTRCVYCHVQSLARLLLLLLLLLLLSSSSSSSARLLQPGPRMQPAHMHARALMRSCTHAHVTAARGDHLNGH
jgi:hypothetical protein